MAIDWSEAVPLPILQRQAALLRSMQELREEAEKLLDAYKRLQADLDRMDADYTL